MKPSIINDPIKAGQLADRPELYGPHLQGYGPQFQLYPVHTRFEAVEWFVLDRAQREPDGSDKVVGQHATADLAFEQVASLLCKLLPEGSPDIMAMDSEGLNAFYEETIGYRPQVDDPTMSTSSLRALVADVARGED